MRRMSSPSPGGAGRSVPERLVAIMAGLLVAALTISACTPWETGGPPGPGRPEEATTALADCPTLRPGQRDPINGKSCVQALQKALRDHGYSAQPVTGAFLDRTTANVVDFQRRRGIDPDGIIGPQTRTALSSRTEPAVEAPISTYITGVQRSGGETSVALRDQRLAAGSADGPAITVEGTATVVNGGSLRVSVTASAPFTRLLVGVRPGPATHRAVTGYYDTGATAPTTSAELVLTLAQSLPGDSFSFSYAAVDEHGRQGTPSQQAADVIPVGTGQVQVSVSWDAASDVDLHVIDPSGDEVFYDNTRVPSGGVLDLDSNAECKIDQRNNENITWSEAPKGEFVVLLDYWDSCDVGQTNYVVTVHEPGRPARTFSGYLTGTGDQGKAGSGQPITKFTVGGDGRDTEENRADRSRVQLPDHGSLQRSVRLTNEVTTPYGVGHPTNTGPCRIVLNGIDANGKLIPMQSDTHLILEPGESAKWYKAAPGAVAIVAASWADCDKPAEITFDTPHG